MRVKNNRWKRNAGFFIAGQFLSMFGSMLVTFAITWQVTLQEQSGALMALFTCAITLPMVIISPFSGVWADRYNRKYLINISDGLIALVTLIAAFLYGSGMQSVGLLLSIIIIRSFGQGVQQPAVNALIPQLVPSEHLMRFNGIQSTLQSLVLFAAPMVAGALLTFLSIEKIFYIDVITALIGIATVFFCVKVSKLETNKEQLTGIKSYLNDVKEGLNFIAKKKWLRELFISIALFAVLAAPAAMLTPLQVTRTFGVDVWRLSAVEITFSLGMVLGGILISIWGGFKNKLHTMILAWFLFGFSTILFGIVPNFWIYLAVMIFCGCTIPLYNTPSLTILQSEIPPELMGRVFSVFMVVNGIAMPLSMSVFGPLGDKIKIEWLLIVTGIILVLGAFVLSKSKALLAVGKDASEELKVN